MTKITLFLILFSVASFASEQLILVMAEDINRSSGTLQRYEKRGEWEKVGSPVSVTLGRNGMGYARGTEPLKVEGDGRTPSGEFAIRTTFGYDDAPNSAMPYLHADEHLICVDDPDDPRYNRIVRTDGGKLPASFEWMRREDDVYRDGVVIDYNGAGEKGRGSCIFIHRNHDDRRPTSGCTAMDETPLKELLGWLDPAKEPVIVQIPKSECEHYRKKFSGVDCN